MKNGWTGGQYSIARAVLAAYVCGQLVPLVPGDAGLVATGVLAAVFLALGLFDRFAAIVCLGVLAALFIRGPLAANAAVPFIGWLLLVHLAVPPAPYGSLAARGRIDPGGGWRLPRATFAATWIGLAVGYVYFTVQGWNDSAWVMLVMHIFAFDPAWVRGVRPGRETLFFDGGCGLCHASVRFALAEAPEDNTLVFAELFGETFRNCVPADANIPDSIAILTADDRILVRSTAALHLAARLGGYWRIIALALRIVPSGLADWAYDRIARVRHRLFRKPSDACPLLPPSLRQRIVP